MCVCLCVRVCGEAKLGEKRAFGEAERFPEPSGAGGGGVGVGLRRSCIQEWRQGELWIPKGCPSDLAGKTSSSLVFPLRPRPRLPLLA